MFVLLITKLGNSFVPEAELPISIKRLDIWPAMGLVLQRRAAGIYLTINFTNVKQLGPCL